ncbi:DUF4258 domain-containing protein [Bacillus badius]|uniref:DUF4258 domain-containing protein n=1 Tax=Bacillus badius TaxID=1455 RepID=UPI000597D660|nr:DUF4258 domain-containing protein [Bacillus badius]
MARVVVVDYMTCCNEQECQRKREKWFHLQSQFSPKGQKELEDFRLNMANGTHKILFDKHFYKRSLERSISEAAFKEVFDCGWVIERNKNSKGISLVLLGYVGKQYRPLHIVMDRINENVWVAVTAYDPQTHVWKWNDRFDERVCFCNPEDREGVQLL